MNTTDYNSIDNATWVVPDATTGCFSDIDNSSFCGNVSTDPNTTTADPSNGRHYDIITICKYALCERRVTFRYYGYCKSAFDQFEKSVEMEEQLSHTISSASKALISTLFAIILILSVFGNSLVVLTFISNKHMRSVTNVFILSLAISDLVVAFGCIPIDIGLVLHPYWVFGQFGCKMLPCIHQFSVACSSLTLCCIAFDRYYAIVYPLKLKFLQTPTRATILQVCVWVTSAAVSIPYAVFFETVGLSTCVKYSHNPLKEVCFAKNFQDTKKIFDVWVTLIVLFFGPFLFMSVLYTIICYKLWVQRPIGASRRTFDNKLKLKQRAIKMLITVVVVFVICWCPVLLFNAVATIHGVEATSATKNLRAFLQCLSLSSTCWNPLVYAYMNEKFRTAFRTLLFCRKGQVAPAMTRKNNLRMSTQSKKTTSQLEMPNITTRSPQTSETKA